MPGRQLRCVFVMRIGRILPQKRSLRGGIPVPRHCKPATHTPMSLQTSYAYFYVIANQFSNWCGNLSPPACHCEPVRRLVWQSPKYLDSLKTPPCCLLTPSRLRRAHSPSGEGVAIPQSAWHLTAPFTQGSHSTIQPKLYYARDCTQGHSLRSSRQCAHCLGMTKAWVRRIAQAYFSMTEVSWGSSCCFRERSPWWKMRSAVGSSGKASLPQAVRLPPK